MRVLFTRPQRPQVPENIPDGYFSPVLTLRMTGNNGFVPDLRCGGLLPRERCCEIVHVSHRKATAYLFWLVGVIIENTLPSSTVTPNYKWDGQRCRRLKSTYCMWL